MPYFTAAAFRGFGDDEGSFYGVFGTLFAALDAQEQHASLAAGKESFKMAPSLGDSGAAWEPVRAFYAHWALFATLKTFAWADEYNLAEASNRKVTLDPKLPSFPNLPNPPNIPNLPNSCMTLGPGS